MEILLGHAPRTDVSAARVLEHGFSLDRSR
jgi:hypothetical protein